ncbi:MAG TPA: PH domain-containing protein [Candidatus Kapabacteria bacterium]|nr:PH domain-containing protein [Candidatus Kapabacteria bacterium]
MMQAEEHEYSEERGLHPLTLLYNGIRSSPALLFALYYGILEKSSADWINALIMVLIFVTIAPSILLKFFFFKFRITNSEIYVDSGVIAKQKRVIPITKVQNVNLSQNFIQKLLGLMRVQIETAGDSGTECVLEYVSIKDANAISSIIKHYQTKSANTELLPDTKIYDVPDSTKDDSVLFQMSINDNLKYGALRFRPLFIVFGAWLYSASQQFSSISNQMSDYMDMGAEQIVTMDILSLSLLVSVSILMILISSWIMDIIWTTNINYNFTLKYELNKLNIKSGFLSKSNITIPFKKVQQISIITNILKERFGYYGLRLYTAGFGLQVKGNNLAVPNSKLDKVYEVLDKIKKYRIPEEFEQISRKSIRRASLRYSISLLTCVAVLYFYNSKISFLLILLPFLYYFAYLDWRNRGYYFENNTLYIKYGVFSKRINIVSVNKIQLLKISETFFQRRLGLATLILDTAAIDIGAETIIRDIDKDIAYELFDKISEKLNLNMKR